MTPKESKKIGKKNNFYLYLYNFIKETGRKPTGQHSKQKIEYYFKPLKDANLVEQVSRGVWKTQGNINEFLEKIEVKKGKKMIDVTNGSVRGHGFVFQVSIPIFEGWDKREQYLIKERIIYKNIKQGQSLKVRGHTIWLSNRTITIYFAPKMSFFAGDPEESSKHALVECKNTLKAIELLLRANLKRGNGWLINECRGHYALIRNSLAIYYRQKGINKFEIKQNGFTWALIDNSFNLHEFETIEGEKAKSDAKKMQKIFNTLREDPHIINRHERKINEMESVFEKILSNQERASEIQEKTNAQIKTTNEQLASLTLVVTGMAKVLERKL